MWYLFKSVTKTCFIRHKIQDVSKKLFTAPIKLPFSKRIKYVHGIYDTKTYFFISKAKINLGFSKAYRYCMFTSNSSKQILNLSLRYIKNKKSRQHLEFDDSGIYLSKYSTIYNMPINCIDLISGPDKY